MSQWTHVSGCIRVDGIPQMGIVPDLPRLLGRPSTRHHEMEMGKRYVESENMPNGSEGSIQYEIIVAGTGMVYRTIAIWGDLRDFGDAADLKAIDDWFERVVKGCLMVRAAHLLVEKEYGERYLLIAGGGENNENKTISRIDLPEKVDA